MEARHLVWAAVLLFVILAVVEAQPPPIYTQQGLFRYGLDNRDTRLTKGNDISSLPLRLRWGLPFYNKKYWSIYINDNGVLSFDNAFNDHSEQQNPFPVGPIPANTPGEVPTQRILIAPFFANVDITQSGQIYYRQSTEKDLMDRCNAAIRQHFIKFADFQTKFMVIATWVGVGFRGYSGGSAPANTFQVVLATDEFETFAFFRYETIQWTTGTESGGSASTGTGGKAAIMGFNAGNGENYYTQQEYSGQSDPLKTLPQNTNNDETGMFMYQISRITVQYPLCKQGVVRTFPLFDSMLGHSWFFLAGPCFDRTREHWVLFGDVDNPKAVQNCTYHSKWMVYCFTPTLFEVGHMDIALSTDDGLTWPHKGEFDVVKIGDTPQRVTRINPDSEAWLRADRPVTIEWDPRLINFTQVRIDVLAYTETIDPDTGLPGPPNWEEIDEVSYTVPNTGRYTWISRAVFQVNDRNCIGVIRVTRRFKRDDLALWSDLHFLGYIMNDKFQNDPATYANLRCDEFYKREVEGNYAEDLLNNLRPCPCNLTQALADRGRFKPDPMCNMDDAVQDRTQEYCRFRDDVVHCVTSIVPSSTGYDSTCCYDEFENLVYAGDSSSGSFSRRVTIEGIPPYNEPQKVPQLSSGIADLAPYYMCCIWGDHCDYYQEVRPTRDCRWYRSVRPASVFGDPHFGTFDGVIYTFNAKGEYVLMETTEQSQTKFQLQGRFEQIQDRNGVMRMATALTAVAMQQEDREKIMVRKSDRTVLEVYIDTTLLEPDEQTTIRRDSFFITFPQLYEKGNLTQVIVTFIDSEMAVVVNGTQEMLTAQVLVPYRFRNWVRGLFGSWDENKDNDLQSRSGQIFKPTDDPLALYQNFGQTWEIESDGTLFHYEGLTHDDFQDETFVPDFDAPGDTQLPQPTDLERICRGNSYCTYDLMTTGNIELAKATMLAYDQFWLAYGASFDLITCDYLKTPKNGTKTFLRKRDHQVGSEIEFACEDNFILVGSPYRVCEPPQVNQGEFRQGQWSGNEIDNTCVESLICGGLPTPTHGSLRVEGPPENMKVIYSCDENYDLYGRTERFCDTERETWIYIEPYCYHKLNPIEVAGAVVGGIAALVVFIVLIAICCVLQIRSRKRKSHFPGDKVSKKQKRKQKQPKKGDAPDVSGREPAYQVSDTPVEVQRFPKTAIEPSEDPYSRQLRQQLQQRPQYTNVPSRPSPHSSQTLPYAEKDPIPGTGRAPPPEMISPTEPRYGYTDPDSAYPPVGGEEIEMELQHGKSLESWA
ncbi:sushi domain-containing protein 2-like [Acanthaster planci]|uniref:Sushi domain-containing protein 2-like n=1 Tax=Acanthaster planci TaxID=133434 RepID=A0A8B7Z3B3_ACAPL|nr:sushi domain-containing protein 2-like [Acanthaster planci]